MEALQPAPRRRSYNVDSPLRLELGGTLDAVEIAYETYGHLNEAGTNAILVCHALTGSAHASGLAPPPDFWHDGRRVPVRPSKPVHGWWDPIVGDGKAIDTREHFVVCANILGSCYGSTGPASIDPATGRAYGPDFPAITVRDMVRIQRRLLDHLGVKRLVAVVGGSLGGMQVLEWALLYPEFVDSIVPIATSARHSAWGIGLNETARLAIRNDPVWNGGRYAQQPRKGLALARMIAMISYRSAPSFDARFGRRRMPGDEEKAPFQVQSYLDYQGEKLTSRFDANAYLALTHAMDAHDVAAGRGSIEEVLGRIRAPALCVGITSDVLYPPEEQRQLADLIPLGRYREIESVHGHDAFLIEFEALDALLRDFLRDLRPAP